MSRIGLRAIICMHLIAAVSVSATDALADNLAGQASVIDGDTLEIHGTRIRLWGIDAGKQPAIPGRRQPAVPVRRAGGQRSGRFHREAASQLPPGQPGPLRQHGRDLPDWWYRSR